MKPNKNIPKYKDWPKELNGRLLDVIAAHFGIEIAEMVADDLLKKKQSSNQSKASKAPLKRPQKER